MNIRFPRFIYLFCCFTFTACVYVLPSDRIEIPAEVKTKQLPIENAKDVSYLGFAFSEVAWALRFGYSIDEMPINTSLIIFDSSAHHVNLDITVSAFQKLQNLEDLNPLISHTVDTLEQQDPRLAVLFNYAYYSRITESLVNTILGIPNAELQAKWSRLAGMNMALAVDAAKALGSGEEDVMQGSQIAGVLLNGLQGSDIETIDKELSLWRNATEDMVYLASGQPTPAPTPIRLGAAGADIKRSLPSGSAARGEQLMLKYGCIGCHHIDKQATGQSLSSSGSSDGLSMAARAEVIINATDYTGKAVTVEEYLFESIVQPNVYVAEGYPPNVQPQNFGDTLDLQDVADFIAYIMAFK